VLQTFSLTTLTMMRFIIIALVIGIALLEGVVSFVPSPALRTGSAFVQTVGSSSPFVLKQPSTRVVSVELSKTPNEIYGIDRGIPILAFALLLSAWLFTIPPEFRRAHFCASDQCVQARCNNCMTVSEWGSGIQDYYRNGGGIEWDFSIDPNSKMNIFKE
jgi:hypothetical protein